MRTIILNEDQSESEISSIDSGDQVRVMKQHRTSVHQGDQTVITIADQSSFETIFGDTAKYSSIHKLVTTEFGNTIHYYSQEVDGGKTEPINLRGTYLHDAGEIKGTILQRYPAEGKPWEIITSNCKYSVVEALKKN